jgi:hypothetical protein
LKTCFRLLVPLILLSTSLVLAGQDDGRPAHPTSFIESRQGNHPDGPDMIGHATISKDDTLMCMLVGVYDETHQAKTACVVTFKGAGKLTLAHGQFVKSTADSEVSLECWGRVPRRCMIEVNDPVNQPPVRQAAKSSSQ